jgi:hypothetical protein
MNGMGERASQFLTTGYLIYVSLVEPRERRYAVDHGHLESAKQFSYHKTSEVRR